MLAAIVVFGLAVSVPEADLHRCLGIEDEASRLHCYDRLFERSSRPAPAAPTPNEPAATAAAPTGPAGAVAPATTGALGQPASPPQSDIPRPDAAFGLTVEKRPEGKVKSISGTIVEVLSSTTGRHVLVLDDGQRWRQVEATTHPAFSSGETVVIRRASLGSYLATVPDSGRGAVRVRRED